MGRPKEGWKIRWRKGRPAEVRFTHDGKDHNIGLGTRDPVEAAEKAERVYADTVRGVYVQQRRAPATEGKAFAEAGAEWLAQTVGTLREKTREIYLTYLGHLGRTFATLGDCTEPRMRQYTSARLAVVQAASIRKELSVLRSVLEYSHGQGWIRDLPNVPSLPKRAKGTRFEKRRRSAADMHSPEDMERLLAALPEWSRSRRVEKPFPIRARFILGYDQAFRPEFLDVLEVPTHWSRGRPGILVPAEHDKCGVERIVPLTERSLAALKSVAPSEGLVFGKHDYRPAIKQAAKATLTPDKAARFCGQHFRSAGLTYLVEIGNLTAAQWIAGHTQVSTTARYIRPSEQEAAKVIELSSRKRRQAG